MIDDVWAGGEPVVMVGVAHTCTGTVVAGGALVHTRACSVHAEAAEVAALRQQLDDARAERDLAEKFGVDRALAALDSDHVLEVLVAHQRRDITSCCCGWAHLGHSHAAHVLEQIVAVVRAAVDSYRSAAPAEPATVWTPAKDGDTPGQRGIEDDPPQPIVAGVPVDTEEANQRPVEPCPEGFHWIGQHLSACDECGLPAWEHDGMARPERQPESPFTDVRLVLDPWEPGERERVRARWGGVLS